jgi:hypothetical protein
MEKGISNPAQPEFSNPDYYAMRDELVERKMRQKGLPRSGNHCSILLRY